MSAEGRCPSGVVAAGSDPLAVRALTQQARAAAQAQWRGVQPPASTLSRSPPASIRTARTLKKERSKRTYQVLGNEQNIPGIKIT